MTTAPTDQEAIKAARRIKRSHRCCAVGCLLPVIFVAVIVPKFCFENRNLFSTASILFVCFLLGTFLWLGVANLWSAPSSSADMFSKRDEDYGRNETILRAFARDRNWLTQSHELMTIKSIIERIDKNDLAPRPAPPPPAPIPEVPRSRSAPHSKVRQTSQKPRNVPNKSLSDRSKPENPEENVIPRTERGSDIPEILMGERRRLEKLRQTDAAKSSEENLVEPPHDLPSPPAATLPTEQSVPMISPPAPQKPIGPPLNQGTNRDIPKPLPLAKSSQPPKPIIKGKEGGRVLVNRYAPVRDPRLRAEAIAIHGNSCCVCGFDFNKVYGEDLAFGYIEVHHLKPVGEGERMTNAHTDLAPLCSNCHVMADRLFSVELFPPDTIEELRAVFEKRMKSRQRWRNL